MSNESVKGTLNRTTSNAPAKKEMSFPVMLEAYKGEIARALPRHMNADRLARIALTEFRKNPKLAECAPKSVFAAIIIASQLGLEPGLLGQAYLIPFKSECQLIPGYQGLIDLVRRTGKVKRIEAHVVRDGDKFTYKTGLVTVLEHEPNLDSEPGPMRLAYAVAEFEDGGYHVEVMSRHQIESIRDNSQGYKSAILYKKDHPWLSNADEMWRKTLIRRICKYLPKSAELMTALALDDAAGNGAQGITVEDAVMGEWNGPIVEVTTVEAEKKKETETKQDGVSDIVTPIERREASAPSPEPPPGYATLPSGSNKTGADTYDPAAFRAALSKKLLDATHLYEEKDRKGMRDHFFRTFKIEKVTDLPEELFGEAERMVDEMIELAPKKGA